MWRSAKSPRQPAPAPQSVVPHVTHEPQPTSQSGPDSRASSLRTGEQRHPGAEQQTPDERLAQDRSPELRNPESRNSESQNGDSRDASLRPGEPASPDLKMADRRTLSRNSTDGHHLLNELRGQPGYGVVMTSTTDLAEDAQPGKVPQSLGQRLNHELDLAVRRERQVLELIDLSNRPARELTPDQFRRLLEAIS